MRVIFAFVNGKHELCACHRFFAAGRCRPTRPWASCCGRFGWRRSAHCQQMGNPARDHRRSRRCRCMIFGGFPVQRAIRRVDRTGRKSGRKDHRILDSDQPAVEAVTSAGVLGAGQFLRADIGPVDVRKAGKAFWGEGAVTAGPVVTVLCRIRGCCGAARTAVRTLRLRCRGSAWRRCGRIGFDGDRRAALLSGPAGREDSGPPATE